MSHLISAKLPYFPILCHDELLYSAFARYHRDSGNVSIKATVTDLFGSSTACAVLDLPTRLDQFCGMLSPLTLLTADRLINDHTLLPLFRPFMPRQRLEKLVSWMRGSNRGGSIHMSAGVMASSVRSPSFLHCCPECLKDDKKSDAEQPYWHRCHQVPGVWICHIHGSWLVKTRIPIAAASNKHAYYLPPTDDELRTCIPLGDDRFHIHLRQIADSVAWLLQASPDLIPGLRPLHKRYLHFLQMNDLATYSGRVKQRELLGRFLSYYGTKFLEQLFCGIDLDAQDNWLSALVRKPRKTTHPLRHLLLIHFLGLKPDQFLGRIPAFNPFGRGPWPCLNPAAPHYRERVITRCEYDHVNERGEPVGIFYCNCGYTYGRAKHEEGDNDPFLKGWVKSFGPVWETELLRMVRQEGQSLRETARKLEVDVNTVKLHLNRLSEDEIWITGPVNENNIRDDESALRRGNWLRILNQFPEKGRKDLREQAKADFAWLYRHDQEWLFKHQPEPIVRPAAKERIDWQERDSELASRISSAAEEIKKLPGSPRRISIAAIGNHLGRRALLEKKLHKLPTTAQVLKTLTDCDESFIERRVTYAIEVLWMEGLPLVPWRILRRAAIRDSSAVQEIIKRCLNDQVNA